MQNLVLDTPKNAKAQPNDGDHTVTSVANASVRSVHRGCLAGLHASHGTEGTHKHSLVSTHVAYI